MIFPEDVKCCEIGTIFAFFQCSPALCKLDVKKLTFLRESETRCQISFVSALDLGFNRHFVTIPSPFRRTFNPLSTKRFRQLCDDVTIFPHTPCRSAMV